MTSPKINNEVSVMQALWRVAYRKGKHEILLPTLSDCRRIRFALYNAMRPVRQGKLVDPELAAAAEECSISIEGTTLVIQAKSRTAAMSAVLASLGGEVEALLQESPKTAEETEIEASQARLLQQLGNAEGKEVSPATDSPLPPAAGTRVTPYYTR